MIEQRRDLQRRKRIKNRNAWIFFLFFVGMFLLFILGLIFPLRPAVSEIEKRELEKFPDFTWETFANGEYFSQISDWYADTYPFREFLIFADSKVKGLYGIKGEELYGNVQTADKIPEPEKNPKEQVTKKLEEKVIPAMKTTNPPKEKRIAENEKRAAEDEDKAAENKEEMDVYESRETAGSVYIINGQGFDLYYFNQESADLYAAVMKEAAQQLQEEAEVYSMIVPTSAGICLSQQLQKELNCSPQDKAIDYIYSQMGEKIKEISVFDILEKHSGEYIYFYTDHHWTALGAYYAYVEFAKLKGIEPKSYQDYEKMEFSDFIGSFYASSNQSETLKNNPDTIVACVPSSTNLMTIEEKGEGEKRWNIIYDVSEYYSGVKYSCFIGGDNPYARIDNPNQSDGSSCLVVKDSYGNAFVPFLVDHYQTVYIIDYRSSEEGLVTFVKENDVQDVIFLTSLSSIAVKTSQMIQSLLK